jgi:hypothetical protein
MDSMKKDAFGDFFQSSLNTLAQTGTINKEIGTGKVIIVNGKGSDLANDKALKGRAKRKMITQKMIFSLIDVARKKEDREKMDSYWNTFYCQSKIYTADGKLYARYCKNRFCTLCCSIRKADIINRYLPTISEWPEPYFVTLTAKSLPKTRLSKRMQDMNRGFRIITARNRKRALRGKGVRLVGIKSLECNFNPDKRTYNPHLHMIVATKEMAEIIISEWLKLCPYPYASRKAQKMRRVTNNEKALIEIVKYGSKIFTEPNVTIKSKDKANRDIYAAALDNIFDAMKACRIFDRFGFNLPTTARETHATALKEYDEWEFDPKQFDWRQLSNENTLSGYLPPEELRNLLEYNIDITLE